MPIETLKKARPRRFRWQYIGIAAALVVCGWNFVAGLDRAGSGPGREPNPVAAPTRRAVLPSPSVSLPATTVEGGPTTSFDMPIGTAVRFTDQDGTWTVGLLGVEWVDGCEDALGSTVPMVALDFRYEVTAGAVSIIPRTDFTFVLGNGTKARAGLLPTCAEPLLDYTIVSAGQVKRGWVAIELPAGAAGAGGTLAYGQLGVPTATWTVPARRA